MFLRCTVRRNNGRQAFAGTEAEVAEFSEFVAPGRSTMRCRSSRAWIRARSRRRAAGPGRSR